MKPITMPNYKRVVAKIKKLKGAIEVRKFMELCAIHQLGEMRPRVLRGINVTGGKFPAYSTKAFYFPKKTPGLRSKVKPVGKTGKKTFANGNKHKSQYFAGGYSEFRRKMGLSNRNRLSLRGKMLASMTVKPYTADGAQIAFSRRIENLKAAGNNEKYNFWGFTRDEQKSNLNFADRLFQDELKEVME